MKYKSVLSETLVKEYYDKEFSGVHPAASIFPHAVGEDFDAICDDIKENGLQRPIQRDKQTKLLVDGRTRLMACYATETEIIVEEVEHDDYIKFCTSANLARKHWTKQQLAVIAVEIAKLYEGEAKKKIGGYKKSSGKKLSNDRDSGKSTVKAGKQLKVNSDYVQKAKTVEEYAPDLIQKVKTNEIDLKDAFKEAQQIKRELKKEEKANEGITKEQVPIIDVKGNVLVMVNKPNKHQFNKENSDSIDWSGWSWNPITGCNHGCDFCYARETATSGRYQSYPSEVGFTPAFHEHRLVAPVNTIVPDSDDPRDKRVFVCSMADLFGKWIPDEWIQKVFDACMTNPDWEYLFLTKWANRYHMLEKLPNAWFGASVTMQKEVAQVEKQMKAFNTTGIKWISLEPMLEPIKFNDISWCDFMVIGSQRATNQPFGHVQAKPVHFEWVYDVVTQCREQGVPIYLKENLGGEGTIWTKQEPRRRTELLKAA